ncbi:soluble lamin-associated protein of 75 kDa-like [Prorops nasuta]|uniref:soluble lamin-associated protein of 75 kDa-like n=1 Tax=Prorops nasuta TaxID=863751 RepID=UPI0034CF3F12
MSCLRCLKIHVEATIETPLCLESFKISDRIYRIDCNMCKKFINLKVGNEVIDINEPNEKFGSYWRMALNNRDKIIYYILSQILYPEFDTPDPTKMESPYEFADEFDKIIIRWENGKAIGFYTIKPKGCKNSLTNEEYMMPIIDTVYIRSEYRNQGYGTEMLKDIVTRFPNDDIGFSKPISFGMQKVLKKFLLCYKQHRRHFWEIADHDMNDSQQLIWFNLKNKNF